MKNILPYIVLFVGSLLTVTLVVAILFVVKPELFSRGSVPSQQAAADSAATHGAKHDSTVVARTDSVARDSSVAKTAAPDYAHLADSLNTLVITLENAKKTTVDLRRQIDSLMAQKGGGDTLRAKERKSTAKVLESMQAESAAKILKDLNDDEVKELLVYVKKRQAAKILSAIEPERAARILR